MKRFQCKTWRGIAMLVAVGAVSGANAATVDITLRERVAPNGSVVRLGDVAEIATADRQKARQLSDLPLMPAPARGTERYIRAREIQDMLAAQGVETTELRFAGAEKVVIVGTKGFGTSDDDLRRSDRRVAPATMNRHAAILAGASVEPAAVRIDDVRAEKLRQQLTGIIADYVDAKTGKHESWRIDCDVTDRELARLARATSALVCTGGSAPWTGRQRLLVSFSTEDGPAQLPVFAAVLPPPMPAVVATRPIARGDVIRAADIELRMVEANPKGGQRTAVDSTEKLIGMEARQAIRAGEVVHSDDVQAPVLVKRGEVITVSSQSGGIRVRTSARALRDGANGDLVQVESLGSREKFDVKIIGPREAAVFSVIRR